MTNNKVSECCTGGNSCTYVPSAEEERQIKYEMLMGRIKYIWYVFLSLLTLPFELVLYLIEYVRRSMNNGRYTPSYVPLHAPIVLPIDSKTGRLEKPTNGDRWYTKELGANDSQIEMENMMWESDAAKEQEQ